ncbi:hypothetical protein GGI17_005825 [Coemansia sp. S146]|nr:hypothetical protein GGI17_005825 [Coemansia sp. S146]
MSALLSARRWRPTLLLRLYSQKAERTFDKILVANRGEIACRVMRTARRMGIRTVAVYSDADAEAVFVREADEAVRVGAAPSTQSYLNMDAILEAVRASGAQAVHPGYGFLSENSAFVKQLEAAGVAFIGPREHALAAMGDKIQSKIIAREAGVNTIPGFDGVVRDAAHAAEIAEEIGYPVMLKASAGGGGKGMRVAHTPDEVREGFQLASDEAASSFGDRRLLVEKFIEEPRHIEIQVLADGLGNVLWLPERECSIQRRNQKVVEEAPSTHLDEATRRRMGEQAVALARSVGYNSAGTVEFLVDKHRNFYFLEMNTRLQVEHPITELVTGLDLVEEMIRSAAGLPLTTTQQADVRMDGWAIEARVYAEDPEKFLPSIGTLARYREPIAGPSEKVRCDSGVAEGSEISVYYDPMISKLSAHGPTRNAAIAALSRALDRYLITGVTHNIPLLRDVVASPAFAAGRTSTSFLAEHYPHGFKGHRLDERSAPQLAAAAAALQFIRSARDNVSASASASASGPADYSLLLPQLLDDGSIAKLEARVALQLQSATLNLSGTNDFQATVIVNGQPQTIKFTVKWNVDQPFADIVYQSDTSSESILFLAPLPLGMRVQFRGTKFDVDVLSPEQRELLRLMKEKEKLDTSRLVLAPMPGTIISVAVSVGDVVAEGAQVAVVEAMKMQNVLRAPRPGVVKAVHVVPGATVSGDDILVELSDD